MKNLTGFAKGRREFFAARGACLPMAEGTVYPVLTSEIPRPSPE
jgi:hypothetical protein